MPKIEVEKVNESKNMLNELKIDDLESMESNRDLDTNPSSSKISSRAPVLLNHSML